MEKKQNNVLCVAATSDGKSLAVGTRTGEVHLWSTFSTYKPPPLKSFCRMIINSHSSIKRKEITHLSISQQLINYLLYKDIRIK